MRLIKITLVSWLCMLMWQQASAQYDIHYTQFDLSPLGLNPANTGAFEGTFRLGGIYRNQWSGVVPYSTPSVYIDAPILAVRKNRDWIGVGAVVHADKAGAGNLTQNSVLGSLAYHIGLDKKQKNVFTIGLQGGYVQRAVDIAEGSGLTFEDEKLTGTTSQDRSRFQNKRSYYDFNAGLGLRSKLSTKTTMHLGVAVAHLFKPKYSLRQGATDDASRLPLRTTANAIFDIDLNTKWKFYPALVYQRIATANELAFQGVMGYKLNPANRVVLRMGAGYRVGDAAQVLLGLDYKDFRAGLAYDINVSPLREASRHHGGIEIGVSYIARIFKKPTVQPVIFCPRF